MTDHVMDRPGGTLDSEVLDLASRLFDWARSGDAATLAAYLDAGVPVNLTNTNGDTLVMLAAYYGHESTVAALIAGGADVNRHNNRGQTPFSVVPDGDHDHGTAGGRGCRSAGRSAVRA